MKRKISISLLSIVLATVIAGCSNSSPIDRFFDAVNDAINRIEDMDGQITQFDNFSENDLKYELTKQDRQRLIDSLCQYEINDFNDYIAAENPDSLIIKGLRRQLNRNLALIVHQIDDCHTFGEFFLVFADMNMMSMYGLNTWETAADFLPKLNESEVVDHYIAFYRDETDCYDNKTWSIAKCHRAFHHAVYENMAISDASKKRIIDSVSHDAIVRRQEAMAECDDSTTLISEDELRSYIASEFEHCRNFRDLPMLWFLTTADEIPPTLL